MNFGGTGELTNLEVVHSILRFCGKDETLIQFVEDRLGHDRRYAIDYSKATESLLEAPCRLGRRHQLHTIVLHLHILKCISDS